MNDLETVMWRAWETVGPMLRANPDELAARLARRRLKTMAQPLRAFCLAVRACDRRITPRTAIITPAHALEPRSWLHPGRLAEHEVVLDARLLRDLCAAAPVHVCGEPWHEVAPRLGVERRALGVLERSGRVRVERMAGLGGRRGKPVPVVYTDEPFDPCARGKNGPDAAWGSLWRFRGTSLPDDFAATLVRRPGYRLMRGKETWWGWRWVCPGCGEEARTLYYPLPVPDWGDYVGLAPACDADAAPEPMPCFACVRCHRPEWFTRADVVSAWGQLVLHLSGGLLYGREVQRPAWLTTGRKVAYRARRTRPSPRRDAVLREIVGTTRTFKEIARDLGIAYRAVGNYASRLYRKYGVVGREELRKVALPVATKSQGEARAAG